MKSLLLVYERTLSSKSGSVIGATVVISLRSMGIIQNLANHKMAKLHNWCTGKRYPGSRGTSVSTGTIIISLHNIPIESTAPQTNKTPPTLPTPPTPPATVSPPHHALLGKP